MVRFVDVVDEVDDADYDVVLKANFVAFDAAVSDVSVANCDALHWLEIMSRRNSEYDTDWSMLL